jgi:type II secretory pathway pseudopilin PulG
MKTFVFDSRRRQQAMTLPELMIAAGVFTLAMVALITIHLNGLRLNQWARAKMGASDEARDAISRMVTEIRGAGTVRIGSGTISAFSEIPHGQIQRGNAIEIHPVKGVTNTWIRYYWDLGDQRLKRTENGNTAVLIVANAITNNMVFTSEDYRGSVLTNNFNNRVIGVTLEFFQLQNPTVPIGPGSVFDYYRLRTKITRRAIE